MLKVNSFRCQLQSREEIESGYVTPCCFCEEKENFIPHSCDLKEYFLPELNIKDDLANIWKRGPPDNAPNFHMIKSDFGEKNMIKRNLQNEDDLNNYFQRLAIGRNILPECRKTREIINEHSDRSRPNHISHDQMFGTDQQAILDTDTIYYSKKGYLVDAKSSMKKHITQNPRQPIQKNGPSACVEISRKIFRQQDAIYNARYKSQPCLHYKKYKCCPLGLNCHFAHGPDELRHPQMHPKYKTRPCTNFAMTGSCSFGSSCYFQHIQLFRTNENQTLSYLAKI